MNSSRRTLGPFSLVTLAFREVGLAVSSRSAILRASGVTELAGTRALDPVRVEKFVRARRTVAWVFALFGVLAPLGTVAALAVLWWWPESKGDALTFGLHLGLGGTLLYVLTSMFGMVAGALLTRGYARELQRR